MPTRAQKRRTRIGFILYTWQATSVSTKITMLIQNCQGDSDGVEKFSGVINNKQAAASKPTTAGRKPVNTCSTMGWFLYCIKNFDISSMSINEGSTTAKVAVTEPKMPIQWAPPALTTDVYPT